MGTAGHEKQKGFPSPRYTQQIPGRARLSAEDLPWDNMLHPSLPPSILTGGPKSKHQKGPGR